MAIEKIKIADYSIYLGDITVSLQEVLAMFPQSRLFILTDENTNRYCKPLLEQSLQGRSYQTYCIPSGESFKNIYTCHTIWSAMTAAGLDRKSLVINLGGGVIGDMGGFCAATYKRGIPFIQIPTTLLSQVDASIGGKLGIDFEGFKNHIGVFQFPQAVLLDPQFLDTLSDRELRSGYAEVIKHALIDDGPFWPTILSIKDLRSQDWQYIIRRSLEVKRKIVEEDPYEKGRRKLLNFGHTIGHAIESQYLDTDHHLLHGEAIAAGMIYESILSTLHAGLPEDDKNSIIQYIVSIFGNPPIFELDKTISVMKQDKKNSNDKISFSFLQRIGVSTWDNLLNENELSSISQFDNK